MAINTQNIRIDLNPGRSIPVAFMHQNDTNRQLTFELYNNGVAYTPASGSTVKFAYKSPIVNGQYSVITGSQMASGTVSGNTVTVTLPSTYTAVSGVGMLTMILTTSNNTLRPINIKLVVQRSADGSDVIAGASDLPDRITEIGDELFQQYLNAYLPAIAPSSAASDGVAAEAKATGEALDAMEADIDSVESTVDSMKNAVSTVYLIDFQPSFTVTESSSASLSLGVNTSASDFITKEYYDVSDGSVKTHTGGSRNVNYYMVKPNSTLHTDTNIIICYYDIAKKFISGLTMSAAGDTTVPSNAYFARFSSKSWDASSGGYNLTTRFLVKTDALVTSLKWQGNELEIPYDSIVDREPLDVVEDSVAELNATFKRYPMLLTRGALSKIKHGVWYYANAITDDSTTNTGTICLYDSNKELKPCYTASEWTATGWPTNGTAGGIAPNNGYSASGHSGYEWPIWSNKTRFKIDGNKMTCYNINGNPRQVEIPLSFIPVYIALYQQTASGANYPRWTIGQQNNDFPNDRYYVEYNTQNTGFMEQIHDSVTNNLMEELSSEELGRRITDESIRSANKLRQALRFASWNIYGAGKHQSNWASLKTELQKYGIDAVAFQEVYDPFDTQNTNGGVTFEDTLKGWHLDQFSDIANLYPLNSRIVAATKEFGFDKATETEYTQQSNYGQRCFVKAEFTLPMWKHKYWSNHIKVSVYDTQLEVGSNSTHTATRLAQVQQLVTAMQADTNPFIILCGDFNEMSTDFSTWNAIREAGFTPALADDSTPTAYRGYYDNIFVNDRISIVNTDVIPYSDNGTNITDHDLVLADLIFDWSNIIAVKQTLVNCSISGVTEWLDRRTTDTVTITITPDSGYTLGAITCGQGNNDLTYNNGAITISGNTITVRPNLVVGDMWISCTATAN